MKAKVAMALVAAACLAQEPELSSPSILTERELGRHLAAEVERQARVVEDENVTGYLRRLGRTLASRSDLRFPLWVGVLDSREARAAALPGGFLYVTSGLIARSETEADLAGTLAHQIAHMAARHAFQPRTPNTLLVVRGGTVGVCSRFDNAAAATPMAWREAALALEPEADRLGLGYLQQAGYDGPGQPGRVTTSEFVQMKERLRAWAPIPRPEPPSLRNPR